MKTFCMHNRNRGFSLVEVIVAMAVFMITMLGMLSTISLSWDIVWRTQEKTYVNRILESRLEEIRDLTFDELEALPEEMDFLVLPATTVFNRAVNPEILYSQYEFQRDLYSPQGKVYLQPLDTNLMKVTVVVTWNPGGQERTMNMNTSTYIGRNGVNRQ